MKSHSRFDVSKFNLMIATYNEATPERNLPEVSSYEHFCAAYPVTDREFLRSAGEDLLKRGQLTGCYIVSTSGTTSTPVVMANRIWKNPTDDSYPRQFYNFISENIFRSEDVIANLFFPGGFGLLYEGACRFLEPTGATILPIGRMDSFQNDRPHFQLFQRLGLNTLIGSPSSIVEFARNSAQFSVNINIRKVVFSSEAFYPSKREYIRSIWPAASFYSLYGATEFGLACVGLPTFETNRHHLFEDWFVVEVDNDDNLYITDLKGPLVPIIRYRIGDRGSLVSLPDGSSQLELRGRSDNAFNCGGALIKFETIVQKIRHAGVSVHADDRNIQLILRSGESGQDQMDIVLDLDISENSEIAKSVLAEVSSIKEISEDIRRGAVQLNVLGRDKIHTSRRSKRPAVVDLREISAI
ncbi:hypothetical protein [Mesorhizobium sp. NPDC059025]|uniref:hypothetical protein n=1 Tax=unclassified Mesorhizobium TaxID=325217 RepID=UPI003675FCA6